MAKVDGSEGGGGAVATTLDVRKLQCAQAVMALLRQLVHTPSGGLIDIIWEEPNARRDMMTVVDRQGHSVVSEGERDGSQVLTVAKKLA